MAFLRLKIPEKTVLLACAIGLIGAIAGRLPFVLRWDETIGLGSLFLASSVPEPPPAATVVAISRASSIAFNTSEELDEWPRSIHASLIDALNTAGAKAIIFDIIFSEPRSANEDSALADSIRRAGNVVLLERTRLQPIRQSNTSRNSGIVIERRELPLMEFKSGALGSAPFTLPTVPIRLSQFWLFDRGGSNTPNLPAIALQAYTNTYYGPLIEQIRQQTGSIPAELPLQWEAVQAQGRLESVVRTLRDLFLADQRLANLQAVPTRTDNRASRAAVDPYSALIAMYRNSGNAYLRYYGEARSVPTLDIETILSDNESSAWRDLVRDRVVFVGLAETEQPEQQDMFYSVFSERTGQNLSGVEIGATAFLNLLSQSLIRPVPMPGQLSVLFIWGALLSLLALGIQSRWMFLYFGLAVSLYLVIVGSAFNLANLWLPTVVPLLFQAPAVLTFALLYRNRSERQRQLRLRSALSAYVPDTGIVSDAAIGDIARDATQHEIDGVCLVTDVRGYTRLSESLPPRQLVELMNEYYETLFVVVHAYGGLVTDTAGDSMVAFFGGQWTLGSPHEDATAAALKLIEQVHAFNRRHVDTPLITGVGIHAGNVVTANIGSAGRFNYRAVGDTVNTAARIEGLSRLLNVSTLASSGAFSPKYCSARALGAFWLSGKAVPIELFELSAPDLNKPSLAPGLRLLQDDNRLREAQEWFADAAEQTPEDGPLHFYAQYLRQLAGPWPGSVDLRNT